jgi:hypothetical protein
MVLLARSVVAVCIRLRSSSKSKQPIAAHKSLRKRCRFLFKDKWFEGGIGLARARYVPYRMTMREILRELED